VAGGNFRESPVGVSQMVLFPRGSAHLPRIIDEALGLVAEGHQSVPSGTIHSRGNL
jgi:hypothetical protein